MVEVPGELIAALERWGGPAGRAFVAGLPDRASRFLRRWRLRPDGPPMHGTCALVLPVVRGDGSEAVLKLQLPDEENAGEALALRTWDGAGAVRLLEHDEPTGTLLLERLDASRSLAGVPSRAAVEVIGGLLARLTPVPAPAGLRRLGDLAAAWPERTERALARVRDPRVRRLLADCAAAVREVADEPGDRLLHWDLHYANVLAAGATRVIGRPTAASRPDTLAVGHGQGGEWVAIDPKPLAGDPGFELLPALVNRFEAGEIRWRFDALTALAGLERGRAEAWTMGRVLEASLWDLESDRPPDAARLHIAHALHP